MKLFWKIGLPFIALGIILIALPNTTFCCIKGEIAQTNLVGIASILVAIFVMFLIGVGSSDKSS